MNEYAVTVEGLRVRRGGNEILHGVSFVVPRGSVTGLLGPSGCGKTTLMRAIVGVQIVSGGTISVLGMSAGSRVLRGRIGYATQSLAIYGDLTVTENLRYFAAALRLAALEVERVITETGLNRNAGQIAATLSGGEQSRVSLAVALLGSPPVLVLDEPTVGLDPVLRNELWTLFRRLGDSGTTLLISSHVMDEADRCQRLLFMREGQILADGTPDDLRQRTGTLNLEQAFLYLAQEEPVMS